MFTGRPLTVHPCALQGPRLVRCGPATVAPAAPAPRPSLLSQFMVCSSGQWPCPCSQTGPGPYLLGWRPLTVHPCALRGGGGWHKASVSGCLPLATPIGLSPPGRGGGAALSRASLTQNQTQPGGLGAFSLPRPPQTSVIRQGRDHVALREGQLRQERRRSAHGPQEAGGPQAQCPPRTRTSTLPVWRDPLPPGGCIGNG